MSYWTPRLDINKRNIGSLNINSPNINRRGAGICALAACMFWAGQGLAQTPAAQGIDITVQRNEDGNWKPVSPGFVFSKGDQLRFQVKANFDGYLYVMNYGTSGQYTSLFPRQETGTDNRIKAGTDYSVPATGAFFRVDGPPGYDAVYWVMSPIPLGDGNARPYLPLPPPGSSPPQQTLQPRCDDSILQARGLCVDSAAGPKNIAPDEKLPGNLGSISREQSRDIVIVSQSQSTLVSSPERIEGPVVYKFLVAHR